MARLCALGAWLWFRGNCTCEAEGLIQHPAPDYRNQPCSCIQACPFPGSWQPSLGQLANPVTDYYSYDAMLYMTGAVAQQPDLDLGTLFEGGELEWS